MTWPTTGKPDIPQLFEDYSAGAVAAKSKPPSPSNSATGQNAAMPSDDDLAKSELSRAKLLIDNGRPELATDRLKKLIDQYPHTGPADKARKLLSQLNSGH